MTIELQTLPDDVDALKAIIATLASEAAETLEKTTQSLTESYENKIKYLEEQLRLLNYKLFGRKSEKLSPEDVLQGRLFDEVEAHGEDKTDVEEATDVIRIAGYTRRKGGRRPLPAELPRHDIIHDLPEEEKICACGSERDHIGDEISEKLAMEPAKLWVQRHIRRKYACKKCEGVETEGEGTVKTAPLPPQIIPQGIATPSLLAYIFAGKFCDGLPLYRLEKIFARIGIDLPRSTMCSWPIDILGRYHAFFDLLSGELGRFPLLGIDETRVQVMDEPGKKNTTLSYMWCFRGGGERPVVLFHYAPTRSPREIERFISGYKGYIQTDGYVGYEAVCSREGIIHVGCWSHARRNFVDAAKCSGEGTFAHTVLERIGRLYDVEDEARMKQLSYDQIAALRREKSRPILDKLKEMLESKMHHIAPKSLTGKAIHYALERWDTLLVYLSDGRIPIDNNLVENAIRPFVIGRKNWLFSGSPRGAAASAAMYSLIETAKANGLEPYWYMRYLFEKLPYAKTHDEFWALLPNVVERGKIEGFRRGGVA